MKKRYFAAIGVFALSSSALAQQTCIDLDNLIDTSIFEIAMTFMDGQLSDKSAPQQTARYIDINNKLQILNINFSIYTQNKCPPRKNGITPFKYERQSTDCMMARVRSVDVAAKCNFKTWKPE